MFRVVEHAARYEQLVDTCAALPTDLVAFLRHTGDPYLASLLTVCDVEAVEFRSEPSPADLAERAATWGPVTVVAFSPDDAPWNRPPQPTTLVETTQWPNVLTRRPDFTVRRDVRTYLGVVEPDGTITPVR